MSTFWITYGVLAAQLLIFAVVFHIKSGQQDDTGMGDLFMALILGGFLLVGVAVGIVQLVRYFL